MQQGSKTVKFISKPFKGAIIKIYSPQGQCIGFGKAQGIKVGLDKKAQRIFKRTQVLPGTLFREKVIASRIDEDISDPHMIDYFLTCEKVELI